MLNCLLLALFSGFFGGDSPLLVRTETTAVVPQTTAVVPHLQLLDELRYWMVVIMVFALLSLFYGILVLCLHSVYCFRNCMPFCGVWKAPHEGQMIAAHAGAGEGRGNGR